MCTAGVDQYTWVCFTSIRYGAALLSRAGYKLGFATHFSSTIILGHTVQRIMKNVATVSYFATRVFESWNRLKLQDDRLLLYGHL